MRDKAVILMYHRVVDSLDHQMDYSPDGMIVDKKAFNKQMNYLSRKYNVISLEELTGYLKRNIRLPKTPCVITFDDGWKDVYDNAYPILKKYNLPATVFLTNAYIDGTIPFWEEKLRCLISKIYHIKQNNKSANEKVILKKLKNPEIYYLLLKKKKDFPTSLMRYIKAMREKPLEIKDKTISDIESIVNLHEELDARQFLTYSEIKEMLRNNVNPGVHTMSHFNLTLLSGENLKKEIQESKNNLEYKIGSKIKTFAFPYGKYNERVKSLVEELGFKVSCSTESGFVSKDSDLYSLKRINIHQDVSFSKPFFACRILKMLNVY